MWQVTLWEQRGCYLIMTSSSMTKLLFLFHWHTIPRFAKVHFHLKLVDSFFFFFLSTWSHLSYSCHLSFYSLWTNHISYPRYHYHYHYQASALSPCIYSKFVCIPFGTSAQSHWQNYNVRCMRQTYSLMLNKSVSEKKKCIKITCCILLLYWFIFTVWWP